MLTTEALAAARQLVAAYVAPSPALRWPLLEEATGTETWVKHENHNPTGAFKVRGGLNLVSRLVDAGPVAGLISASRGNHSQSLAFAGREFDVPVTIVVPGGNSPDKNAATKALGAEVVIRGSDFQDAVEYSHALAEARGLVGVAAFHPWLVEGVATYAAELYESVPGLDIIYVPVGMGSGISANTAVRDLIGARTEIVGVVSERAPAYALSYEAGHVVSTPTVDTFVDGVALPHTRPGVRQDHRRRRRTDPACQRGTSRSSHGFELPDNPQPRRTGRLARTRWTSQRTPPGRRQARRRHPHRWQRRLPRAHPSDGTGEPVLTADRADSAARQGRRHAWLTQIHR
jgi:hypothetical protein